MPRATPRKLAVALACFQLACASPDVEPIQSASFAPEEDEQQLWRQAQQLDAQLEKSRNVLPEVELETYLDGVVTRLLSASGVSAPPAPVRVLLDPYANAFALPNGSIYIHTGLLAPMQNEAQLATVLGHELTHYLERHGLKEARVQENREAARMAAVSILAVLAAAGGVPAAAGELLSNPNTLAELMVLRQVAGYSRELESEADARSIAMLRAAGYDAREALAAFELLRDDADATDAQVTYAYASHPKLEERIESIRELLAAQPAASTGNTNQEEFQQRTASVLIANAELELRTSAVVPAQRELERYIALRPDDPRGPRMLADAYRREGPEPEHVRRAAQALETAAGRFPADAGIRLELGMLYRELDDRPRARDSFARYLELAPAAKDRPIIERYVAELE